MSKGTPHYCLDLVKELARQRRYTGVRNALRDSENLGYGGDEKCKLLEELEVKDFNGIYTPPGNPEMIMDSYLVTRRSRINEDLICEIYIKIMVVRDSDGEESAKLVDFRSFHLPR